MSMKEMARISQFARYKIDLLTGTTRFYRHQPRGLAILKIKKIKKSEKILSKSNQIPEISIKVKHCLSFIKTFKISHNFQKKF